jgi:hypothetical protein
MVVRQSSLTTLEKESPAQRILWNTTWQSVQQPLIDQRIPTCFTGIVAVGRVEPWFYTDQPCVEAAGLIGSERGFTVLVNHSPDPCSVTVTARHALGSAAQVSPSGWEILALDGNRWKMELEGCSGAVVEWTL